jgi:glycosyltransferase involved in cell wall biosynthesis
MTAGGETGPTSFSTIIVTRNRPAALALSLPLLLAQSRRPERILVVDSSDDMAANRALVAQAAAAAPMPVEHVASAAGMTLQRNVGLARISSDVVFFPDDDSLLHPGALARMMRIYDLDSAGRIGGVGGAETPVAPEGVLAGAGEGSGAGTSAGSGAAGTGVYRKRGTDRLRARMAERRMRFENRFFPDPMKLAARSLQARLPPPEPWLAARNAVRVEWITGFRMSFRTDVVRKVGFNENLGRYALYEDIDAGLGVLRGGHDLVAARDALIYHHKAPENRANGRQMGVINILNRAYVTLRSGAADAAILAALRRQAQFRLIELRLGARGAYGRDRLAGAQAAFRLLPELIASPPGDLDATYLRLRGTLLDTPP